MSPLGQFAQASEVPIAIIDDRTRAGGFGQRNDDKGTIYNRLLMRSPSVLEEIPQPSKFNNVLGGQDGAD